MTKLIAYMLVPMLMCGILTAQRPGIVPITARTASAQALEYAVQQGYTDVQATTVVALQVYSLDTMLVKTVIDETNKEWLEWNGLDYVWGINLLTSKVSKDSLIIVDVFADSASRPLRCKLKKYSRSEIESYDTIPLGNKWIDSDSVGKLPRLCKEQYLRDKPLFAKHGSFVTIYLYMYFNDAVWSLYEPFETSTSFYASTGEVRTKGTTSVLEDEQDVRTIIPNPITNGFTLAENIQATEIRMYSMMGTESLVWNNCKDVQYFDTHVLPSGVYTVRIQCQSGSVITTSVVIAR